MGTKLSASQAAKLVGKSVPTITRAISKGKLSAQKKDDGGYIIDPAELFRVWPAKGDEGLQEAKPRKGKMFRSATLQNSDETGVLQAKLEAAEARISDLVTSMDDMRSTVDDLRTRLDEERTDRRGTQARLEDLRDKMAAAPMQEAQKSPAGGLFGFLRGKGKTEA